MVHDTASLITSKFADNIHKFSVFEVPEPGFWKAIIRLPEGVFQVSKFPFPQYDKEEEVDRAVWDKTGLYPIEILEPLELIDAQENLLMGKLSTIKNMWRTYSEADKIKMFAEMGDDIRKWADGNPGKAALDLNMWGRNNIDTELLREEVEGIQLTATDIRILISKLKSFGRGVVGATEIAQLAINSAVDPGSPIADALEEANTTLEEFWETWEYWADKLSTLSEHKIQPGKAWRPPRIPWVPLTWRPRGLFAESMHSVGGFNIEVDKQSEMLDDSIFRLDMRAEQVSTLPEFYTGNETPGIELTGRAHMKKDGFYTLHINYMSSDIRENVNWRVFLPWLKKTFKIDRVEGIRASGALWKNKNRSTRDRMSQWLRFAEGLYNFSDIIIQPNKRETQQDNVATWNRWTFDILDKDTPRNEYVPGQIVLDTYKGYPIAEAISFTKPSHMKDKSSVGFFKSSLNQLKKWLPSINQIEGTRTSGAKTINPFQARRPAQVKANRVDNRASFKYEEVIE